MKSLLRRLDIYVVGDRQFVERPVVKLSTQRAERQFESSVDIPDHARKDQHRIRMLRAGVEVGPYTPLLKRLNHNPQGLEQGYFKRASLPRAVISERPKVELSSVVRTELRRDKRHKPFKPMALHHRARTVDRPELSAWLEHRADVPDAPTVPPDHAD